MQEPPIYLQPCLHTIERTVIEIYEEFRSLTDKDVEFVFEKLKDYFRKRSQGKELEEPETSSERKQALIDEILNSLEIREEGEMDLGFINNPNYVAPGGFPIQNLPALYVMCFNRLLKSAKFWRKKDGAKGYLNFIRRHVI